MSAPVLHQITSNTHGDLIITGNLSTAEQRFGGTSTKSTLLKNAVGVFNALMLTADEIALVSFDDLVATPAAMQAASAGAVAPVLAGTDPDPRGLTWIGGGVLQGAVELGLGRFAHASGSNQDERDGVVLPGHSRRRQRHMGVAERVLATHGGCVVALLVEDVRVDVMALGAIGPATAVSCTQTKP